MPYKGGQNQHDNFDEILLAKAKFRSTFEEELSFKTLPTNILIQILIQTQAQNNEVFCKYSTITENESTKPSGLIIASINTKYSLKRIIKYSEYWQ